MFRARARRHSLLTSLACGSLRAPLKAGRKRTHFAQISTL
jgi:hypothetical protein